MAYFTDAFHEANGVATFSREFEQFADRHHIPFLSVHAGTATALRPDAFVTTLELRRSALSFPLDQQLRCDPLLTRYKEAAMGQLKSFGAELVHVTGPGDVGILGAWVAHCLGLPLIASWHTNLQEYAERRVDRLLGWMPARPRRKISAAAERHSMDALVRFYRMARLIMAPNQDMVDLLRERTGKPTLRIGHGVDVEWFTPDRRSRRNDLFTVGYVGRLTPEKNVRWLAGIEQALVERGIQEFRLLLVGAGSEQSWLQANLQRAEFRGILRGPSLAQAFADMDVFVFPSLTDTFGLVILEAMASGVPVIVTPAGGPKYQVRVGQTGFVATTPGDFAACILALKNNSLMHAQMREAARQHACSASWDNVFADVYGIYETVLDKASCKHFSAGANRST